MESAITTQQGENIGILTKMTVVGTSSSPEKSWNVNSDILLALSSTVTGYGTFFRSMMSYGC